MSDWRDVPEPIRWVNDMGQVRWQAQVYTGAVATVGRTFGALIWKHDSEDRPWLRRTSWGVKRLARKRQKQMAKKFWEEQ